MIEDSGERREFDTGAVRDIQEGKGRCDLLPIKEVYEMFKTNIGTGDPVLEGIAKFKETGDLKFIYESVGFFLYSNFGNYSNAMLELAIHFEEGAKKYGEYNWQKGIPIHCYIDSGIRHYLKHDRGDEDERHDRAFIWNMMCLAWTMNNKPELDDYTDVRKKEQQ